jgi:hypothetical protein
MEQAARLFRRLPEFRALLQPGNTVRAVALFWNDVIKAR